MRQSYFSAAFFGAEIRCVHNNLIGGLRFDRCTAAMAA
jgi:hypothetical protein